MAAFHFADFQFLYSLFFRFQLTPDNSLDHSVMPINDKTTKKLKRTMIPLIPAARLLWAIGYRRGAAHWGGDMFACCTAGFASYIENVPTSPSHLMHVAIGRPLAELALKMAKLQCVRSPFCSPFLSPSFLSLYISFFPVSFPLPL